MKTRMTLALAAFALALGLRAGAAEPDRAEVEEVRLTVRPAAPPLPAMRYHFLPELVDQTQGNAALMYVTAAQQMAVARSADPAQPPGASSDDDNIDQWLGTPLKNLPRAQVAALVAKYDPALRQLRLAARRDRCDFDPPFRTEGFRTLLPYLNDARPLARVAALSARLKMMDADLAGAVEDLGLPMTQAGHLNQQPFLSQLLVASAIGQIALRQVQDLIALDGAPNLYWALGDLPAPFLNARGAMKLERAGAYFSIPQLKEARAGKLTAEQWRQALWTMGEVRGLGGGRRPGSPAAAEASEQMMVAMMSVKEYPIAKRYLLEQKVPADAVEAMPVAQAIGLYHVGQFERWTQELDKCLTLPFWQGAPLLRRAEEQMRQATGNGAWSLTGVFAPGIRKAYTGLAMTDRRIAMLRCVEAVRAYAADHGGNPPATLADLTDTPAPLDPMTGRTFAYRVQGDEVTIEGPAVEPPASAQTGLRFVLKVVK